METLPAQSQEFPLSNTELLLCRVLCTLLKIGHGSFVLSSWLWKLHRGVRSGSESVYMRVNHLLNRDRICHQLVVLSDHSSLRCFIRARNRLSVWILRFLLVDEVVLFVLGWAFALGSQIHPHSSCAFNRLYSIFYKESLLKRSRTDFSKKKELTLPNQHRLHRLLLPCSSSCCCTGCSWSGAGLARSASSTNSGSGGVGWGPC